MPGAPKFLDDAKFDITAKAPPPPPGSEVDFDDLVAMLRKLFIERFQMKVHFEERMVDGYVLSAAKPRLQKADPSNRTNCKEGPGADGKDPRITNPILSRLITCQNMTMGEFADRLATLANGYAHMTVLDETGLPDPYDFTLSFSAIQFVKNAPTIGEKPSAEGASDPNGAVPLPDAISRQLGLKLELKKRSTQVLIIDHMEEKPTDN